MGFKIPSSSSLSPNSLSFFFPIFFSLFLFFLSTSSAKPLPHRSDVVLLRRHRTTLHGGAPTIPRQAVLLEYDIANKLPTTEIRRNKNKKTMTTKKKKASAAFSVMLPKGFVPPSASSPCHNQNPQSSLAFYCHLSATNNNP